MRLKSAFTGFFYNRSVVRSSITIVMLVIFFIASSFRKHSDGDMRAKQVNLIIREIGHRLLLQADDATSRVLPVTENQGTFLLRFEKEFAFSHDSLMVLSKSLLPKTLFPSGYTVTVHDCAKGDIIFGFQLNNTSRDILACSGRNEPAGCYTIEFAFPDFYKNAEQKKAGINQLNASSKVNPREVNPISLAIGSEGLKKRTFNSDSDQLTKDPKSVKGDSQEANIMPIAIGTGELKTKTFNYLVYSGMLVLLGVTLLIGRLWKNVKPVAAENQNNAIIKESIPELAALGKFLVDAKGQRLLLGSEVISLTDKEFKVLELLHNSFGELIPRETLMQEVWINEGVITGRSLDMFISKLRKKLSADPELRITNVHGKGYRLEIVNDFIA